MRILQVIGSLNVGGSQTMIMEIYKNIDKENLQFDFIIDRKEELFFAEEIKKIGGKIYVLPSYKIYNHFKYKKEWNNFFKQHPEYKIIHGHVRSTASIYLKIAKKHGLVAISHSHSTSNGKGFSAIIKAILQYRIRFIADYFMACSTKSAEWLFGKKVANSDRCFIIKNSIDIEKFKFNEEIRKKVREDLGIKSDEIVLGHVGRFVPVKNHKFIIRILNELKENKNIRLLLVGDGPLKDEIVKDAEELGLNDKIIFLEKRNDVNELLQAMDIFVFPSIYEGLGTALIEAQVSGLKCIASNQIPAEAKITDNVTFLDLDFNKWVETIQKCNIERDCESNHCIQEYDISNVAKELEQFYLQIRREG